MNTSITRPPEMLHEELRQIRQIAARGAVKPHGTIAPGGGVGVASSSGTASPNRTTRSGSPSSPSSHCINRVPSRDHIPLEPAGEDAEAATASASTTKSGTLLGSLHQPPHTTPALVHRLAGTITSPDMLPLISLVAEQPDDGHSRPSRSNQGSSGATMSPNASMTYSTTGTMPTPNPGLFRRLPGGWIADSSLAPSLINSLANDDTMATSLGAFPGATGGGSPAASTTRPPAQDVALLPPEARFEVLRTLGRGSFSRVFLVRYKQTGVVAVDKVMQWGKEGGDDGSVRRRLAQRDVMLLSNCAHPNIVQFLEAYDVDTATHLICEQLDGGDLSSELQSRVVSRRPLRVEVALRYFVQLCLALDYLHKGGVVHRDVKPANLLLRRGPEHLLKLGDFGFAARKFEENGDQYGTPYYAAPEMWSCVDHGDGADIWSAGVVLYELLCLRLPFPHNSTSRHSAGTKAECVVPALPAAVPQELQDAVQSMLQFDPALRPSLAAVIAVTPLLRRAMEDYAATAQQSPSVDATMREMLGNHIADMLTGVPPQLRGQLAASSPGRRAASPSHGERRS